jgi:hypothetical protein
MLVCVTRNYQLPKEVSGMLTTQRVQDHSSIPSEVSIDLKGCCQEIASAKRELGAFLKAVQSRYGEGAAARAADDWIGIVESAPVPVFRGLWNWRHVTVLASSRLAINHLGYKSRGKQQREGNDAE